MCIHTFFCNVAKQDDLKDSFGKINSFAENTIDNSWVRQKTTYELDDKFGKSHIYDEDLNEIMTYDTESEQYSVGLDNKAPFICLQHKLIEFGMSRYIFYDMKGNKLNFEFEMGGRIISVFNFGLSHI